jgi:hypothetical protein
MKAFLFNIYAENDAAAIEFSLKAESADDAVRLVREEFDRHRKKLDKPSRAVAQALNERGLSDWAADGRGYAAFGIDMRSPNLVTLSVMINPAQITTKNIVAFIDEDGTPHLNLPR